MKQSLNNVNINNKINKIDKEIEIIHNKITTIQVQLDIIIKILNSDVKKNCAKMKEHIDFIETVYDNVKNPLGYLCNKLNYFTNDSGTEYDLHSNLLLYDNSSNIVK